MGLEADGGIAVQEAGKVSAVVEYSNLFKSSLCTCVFCRLPEYLVEIKVYAVKVYGKGNSHFSTMLSPF